MGLSKVLIIGGISVAAVVFVKKIKGKNGTGSSSNVASKPQGTETAPNQILAKKAFLSHLDDFSHLLPSLVNEIELTQWTEAIVTVNDNDLTKLWERYVQSKDVNTKWIQLLASWQVKMDTCKSFTCVTNSNIAAYTLPDGSALSMDVKYKVVTPCWVYTFENEQNQTIKRVISKGIVVPISNS